MIDCIRQETECGPFEDEKQARAWLAGFSAAKPENCTDYGVTQINGRWFACYIRFIDAHNASAFSHYEPVLRVTPDL